MTENTKDMDVRLGNTDADSSLWLINVHVLKR